ncbi:hypothetical protein HZF05_08720 [Sphingomonas sp. CGMCC 1.13654]|uniref:Uncharacterized protein n=1 Tax=Sphingomonas chungangi TaxID=2683589 RepID=A0A838L6B2_9SPHN|nr:hypothetical protein [Sphingomonas chungangi]MBA2934182.1 hypothetical protein [Sphingomonas chungangi]MVW57223.1 hypothetical protein [Sphingomonas chungangi]
MRIRHLILLTATAVSTAQARAPREGQPLRPTLAVVPQGNEPALQYGPTILPRPFGGELVDTLSIIGRYQTGRDTLFLVRGSGGASCPSRYVVVAPSRGGTPLVTAPFGTCALADAKVVRGQLIVAMNADAVGGPAIRYAYIGGQMRPLDAPPPQATADTTCRSYESAGAVGQDAMLAEFDRTFPDEFRHASELKKVAIAPDDLRRLVTGLACFSTWPGAEKMVPEAATPLFASKRYGDASFAALETVSQTPGVDAGVVAAVRQFGAEMRYYVGRRTAL